MKCLLRIGCFFSFFLCFLSSSRTYASSGVIRFSTGTEQVAKGDNLTIVCQVTSSEEFLDTRFSVRYDDRYLQFLGGGKKVSGGNGILQIASEGNTETTNKKTFSLQFQAKKKGTAVVGLKDQAQIVDGDGNPFSVSSNSLSITVRKRDTADIPPVSGTQSVAVTPVPVLGKENRLKKLQVSCVEFSPAFSPDVEDYHVVVDSDTDHVYLNFAPIDEKARVLLKEKDKLIIGDNKVIVRVIAENGQERKYQLNVKRESPDESRKREEEEQTEEEKTKEEKTLQPHTDTVSEGVDQERDSDQDTSPLSNTVLIFIIGVLIVLILVMLIYMLKMATHGKRRT